MSLVLGVDVAGDVVASGSAALTMEHQHDGCAEQDPRAYCTA